MTDQFVYFIQADDNGPIKIGFTADDPKKRIAQLQTGNASTLKLLGFVKGSTSKERELHAALSEWRMQGEWFQSHPTVLEAINEALAADACAQGKHPCGMHCSFCLRCQHEVTLLIAGAAGYICDLCVDTCLEIVTEKRLAAAQSTPQNFEAEPQVQQTSSIPISEGVR